MGACKAMGRGDSHSFGSSGGGTGGSSTSPLAALCSEELGPHSGAAGSSRCSLLGSMCSSGRASAGHKWPRAAQPALLLLLLLTAAGVTHAQQLTPFQGRGRPPAGGVDVYVSAVVDHLVTIDDADYRFEASHRFLFIHFDSLDAVAWRVPVFFCWWVAGW